MKRKQPKISSLGYALLGLLQPKPASGYDLRKIFSSTSMKTYSDSPGAIYPALRRLERQGLVRGTIEDGAGLRRRQVFRVTANGLAQLNSWITGPITPDDLIAREKEILLRFAFAEPAVGTTAALAFLKSLEKAAGEYLSELRQEFTIMNEQAPLSGRLAFQYGIRAYEALWHWTRDAIATYERVQKGGVS
jgi:DNA-binding PadR family transcriptional regulator